MYPYVALSGPLTAKIHALITLAFAEPLLPFAPPQDLDARFGRIGVEMRMIDWSVFLRRAVTSKPCDALRRSEDYPIRAAR
jgi:hypothetical protein